VAGLCYELLGASTGVALRVALTAAVFAVVNALLVATAQTLAGKRGFKNMMSLAVLAFVVWQGGREVIRGSLTAGDLVAFLIYTLTVAGAIGTFTGLYGQLQEALGASQRIFELLDERTDLVEPAEPDEPTDVTGHVVFDDVGFRYSDRDTEGSGPDSQA